MAKTQRQVPVKALHLRAFPIKLASSPDGEEKRSFRGVANSGKPLPHWYWDRFIVDLNSLNLSEVTAGLIDHDFSRRAAAGHLFVEGEQLLVDGDLLTNEHGQSVAKDADDGFPWQMSIHVHPQSVEMVNRGEKATVNGTELSGPIAIFRNSKIHEFSFTAVGVDNDTNAKFLGRGEGDDSVIEIEEVRQMAENNEAQKVEELTATLAEKESEIAQLKLSAASEKERADNAEAVVADLRLSQRKRDVETLLSAKGVEVTDDAAKPYLAMSQEVFDAVNSEAKALLSLGSRAAENNVPQINPRFFQPDTAGQGSQLSQADNPLLNDAKRRAKAQAA